MNAFQRLELGSDEDPLWFLPAMTLIEYFPITLQKKVLVFAWLSGQLITMLGFLEMCYNRDMFWKYFPTISILQGCILVLLVASLTVENTLELAMIHRKNTWSWKLGGTRTCEKLLLQTKPIKTTCRTILCLIVTNALLLCPFRGDEHEYDPVMFLFKKYMLEWNWIGRIAYSIEVSLCCMVAAFAIIMNLHTVCYIAFQFRLLNSFVDRLMSRWTFHINDVRYQERVEIQLKCCIEMHAEILRWHRVTLKGVISFWVLLMVALGLNLFVSSTLFIISEVSPKNNYRMIAIMITSFIVLLTYCECCQTVKDESERVFFKACKCPWQQFNNKNRRTLLMLIANSNKPLAISCYGLIDANYEMILKLWRMVYALITLFINLK